MRILLIHSDHLKYQTKSKTRLAEKISENKKKGEFQNALVVFTAVEKEDEPKPEEVAENAVNEIINVFRNVKAENIVIYPYAHLSSSLGSPESAKKILNNLESKLAKMDLPVSRVPLDGTNLSKCHVKGTLIRAFKKYYSRINSKEEENVEKGEKSHFFILYDGECADLDQFSDLNQDMNKLIDYELGRGESSGEEPPHVKLMREKKLADYEPSADVGHLRWYPKGRLIRDLLSDYVYTLVTDRGQCQLKLLSCTTWLMMQSVCMLKNLENASTVWVEVKKISCSDMLAVLERSESCLIPF